MPPSPPTKQPARDGPEATVGVKRDAVEVTATLRPEQASRSRQGARVAKALGVPVIEVTTPGLLDTVTG
jgi:hypothetical protein